MKKLKLLSSHDEAGNIRTFIFETGDLTWLAGQNQGYVLEQAGKTEDEYERWFTISSAPSEGEIHISTRVSGSAFKQILNSLQPGETIRCHDLDGDFTWEETGDNIVLIAGGIGVTPFRSMLIERAHNQKPLNATLLHFNREEQIPFKAEFARLLETHPELTIHYVVGEPITADKILELAPQASVQLTYLSGPEPMVEAVGGELKKRRVNVKQDWFPGYNEKNY